MDEPDGIMRGTLGRAQSLWVIANDQVHEVGWWQVISGSTALLTPPGEYVARYFHLGADIFFEQGAALRENEERLDGFRAYYEMMAERNRKAKDALDRRIEDERTGLAGGVREKLEQRGEGVKRTEH